MALHHAPDRGPVALQHELTEDVRKPRGVAGGKRGRVALQAGCLLALAVLIVALLSMQISRSGNPLDPVVKPVVSDGQVRLVRPGYRGLSPSPVNNPDRVEQLLKVGQTYAIQTKGGFVARAVDLDYAGDAGPVNLAYAFETLASRTIESNDGRRIVEVRRFEQVKIVKLLSREKDLAIELGAPGTVLLGSLEGGDSRAGGAAVAVNPVAEAILRSGAEAVINDQTSQAFLKVDALAGKTVRITYVDGIGVKSIQPIGCDLTASEFALLSRTAVLCDGYIVPEERCSPGDTWSVPAGQFAGLLDPSMCSTPETELVMGRDPGRTLNGEQYANLRVRSSPLRAPSRGPLLAEGTLRCNLDTGLVETATLNGRAHLEHLFQQPYFPEDHLLAGVEFQTKLAYHVSYYCKVAPAGDERTPGDKQVPSSVQPSAVWPLVEGRRTRGAHASTAVSPGGAQRHAWYVLPDIRAGVLIMLVLSVVLFGCGVRSARRLSRRAWAWGTSAAVASILLFALLFHGTLSLAQLLPFSNVIVLGNWIPLGAALVSGAVVGQRGLPPWRRALLAIMLVSLGWYTLLCNFLGTSPPSHHSWWRNGVCLQTTPASCSPCCAAVLLKNCGIKSSEREMMDLCLTTERGTPPLGLYRGMRLKTRNTRWAVEVVRCSVEELRQADSWPVLVPVRLEGSRVLGSGNTGKGQGSLPGAGHTVVLFGFREDGRVEIGDPACPSNSNGRKWTIDELKERWCGEGLRLIKRDR